MRLPLAILLAMLLLPGLSARAESPPGPTFVGTWAVDLSRLPMPAEQRPKSVTIRFAEAEGGRLAMVVEVVDPSGKTMRAEGVTDLNGTPAAVQGGFEADVSATKMPVPGVLVMQLGRGGIPASTRVYTVVPDGKTMIETAAYFGDDGRPVFRTNYFNRVP